MPINQGWGVRRVKGGTNTYRNRLVTVIRVITSNGRNVNLADATAAAVLAQVAPPPVPLAEAAAAAVLAPTAAAARDGPVLAEAYIVAARALSFFSPQQSNSAKASHARCEALSVRRCAQGAPTLARPARRIDMRIFNSICTHTVAGATRSHAAPDAVSQVIEQEAARRPRRLY